jgi:hypothetical protein
MKQPWWQTDEYDDDAAIVGRVTQFAGPNGIALVKAWPDGRTTQGWGINPPPGSDEGFMPRYLRGEFNPRKALFGYRKGLNAFAFVMRSLRLVCIDIDGKNGGLEHAKRLGVLPPTLAETSKSGDGYHLFYLVDEEWDDELGFGRLSDRIGLEQGVDIRAVGCVYHYDTQRWNDRLVVPLPDHLYQVLTARDQKVAASRERIAKVLETNDELEVLMMQDELIADLAKPIPVGKRNNTLYAIGSKMHEAKIPDWDEKLHARATQLGLDDVEIDKLVQNIERYSGSNAP